MADSSLVISIAQTDPLNAGGRDGKELLREVYNHLGGLLNGAKRATSCTVIADGAALVQATGTVTVDAADVSDTVTIGSVVFTAAAAADFEAREFEIGVTDEETAESLAACVNANPACSATGEAASNTVTLTAIPAGIGGNLVTLASSGSPLAVSGAALSGGTGGNGTVTTITL